HYCVLVVTFLTPPPPPDIHTLSLHDALPILAPSAASVRSSTPAISERCCIWTRCASTSGCCSRTPTSSGISRRTIPDDVGVLLRSEEHTSELQSLRHLVCRLLLEKKKTKIIY